MLTRKAIYEAHCGREFPRNDLTAWNTFPQPTGPERRASDMRNFGHAFVAQIERQRPEAYADRGSAGPAGRQPQHGKA